MVTGLIKGILGILGLFYKESREGSRQPVDLWSFSDLEDIVLDLILAMSRTNDF